MKKTFTLRYLFTIVFLHGGLKGACQTLLAGCDFQTTINGGTAVAVAPNSPSVYVANFGSGNIYLDGSEGSDIWITATTGNELSGATGSTANRGGNGSVFSGITTSPAALSLKGGTGGSANGKYAVFKFSTTAYKDIVISYATQRSTTGFNSQVWEYSSDGLSWSLLQTVDISAISTTAYTVETLPTINGLDNLTNAYIRFSGTGASGATGSNFLDNIQLNATPIPFKYRSHQPGDWNTSATWEISRDNVNWTYPPPLGLTPSSADSEITIQSGHTVTISTSVVTDQTTVDGTLQISGSGVLNLNNGSGDDLAAGSTGVIDAGSTAFIIPSASSTINVSGKLRTAFFNGLTGSTTTLIPRGTLTLNSGSTVEYYASSGAQNVTPRADYYNVTFSGGGTKTVSPNNPSTVLGKVYITGLATLDAASNTFGGATTNLIMDGGRFRMTGTTTKPDIDGTYTLTGGVIEFYNSLGTAQTIKGTSSLSNPIVYNEVEVSGSNVTQSNDEIYLNQSGGKFTVKGTGTFTMSNHSIRSNAAINSSSVIVETGGTFITNSSMGFSGFTTTTFPSNNSSIYSNIDASNIILNNGSTVNYDRTSDQIISNQIPYQNLSISGSGNKTAQSGILTVRGNLTKSGTSMFLHNNGSVLLDGADQNFAGLTYNNLLLTNSTKTTNGNSTIIDSIKINDGTALSISAPDIITLHSDALKTGRVGQIGTGTISYNSTGKFIVERFIPATKAWRFLSIPTSSAQTIKEAWQEGALMESDNPAFTYGTQITSDRSTWLGDGFDRQTFAPSAKTYDPGTNTYSGITSTNNSFDAGTGGYMTFIRGDRTATSLGSPVTQTTLRTAGALFTGNQPPVTLIPGQFIPVNNPFASQLDLSNVSRDPAIFYYVLDPNMGSGYGYGYGAIQTLFWNGASYTVIPGGTGSYGTTTNYIAEGQSFFASGNTSIQLTEGAKTAATTAVIPFTPAGVPATELRINLYSLHEGGSAHLTDGVLTSFSDNYSNSTDEFDARKFFNFGENLAIINNNTLLAIERRHTVQKQDTIFLQLTGTIQHPYRIEIIPAAFSQTGLDAVLEDNYLQSRTALGVKDTTKYDFAADANAGSVAPDRFRLLLSAAAGPLPVTVTNVTAYPKNDGIEVKWTVDNEMELAAYEVEKSITATNFISVASIEAHANSITRNYRWLDMQPITGYNYYRIKILYKSGAFQFSSIAKAFVEKLKQGIHIYPNPLVNGIINLQFVDVPAGNYRLRLINKSGQLIMVKEIQRSGIGSNTEIISVKGYEAHGIYRLEVTKPDGSSVNFNVAL